MHNPSVTIIVPCRNERSHIEAAVLSILSQQNVPGSFEIVVADGMSDDGTKEVLELIAAREPRLRIIDNPGRIVSTGLNAAIAAARGNIIIRMDAHTEYAEDYIKQCVEVLERSGADNVGGPWSAKGRSYLQKAIALAFQFPFSSGGAGSHRLDYEGEVDSVYLGCWRKACLERLGLFDEELVRNQDDELNLRLVRSGGRLWQSPSIRSSYFPRSSLLALFRQQAQYGYWKVRVIQKHRIPASLRHLVPGGFVGAVLLLGVLLPFSKWAGLALSGLLGSYLLANVGATLVCCQSAAYWKYISVMPSVFAAYHFGYGWGFLRGMFDFLLLKRTGGQQYRSLTR